MFRHKDTETLYRQGVARWAERDLSGAVDLLEAALAARRRPDDGWWFSASRALAQVAMEQDDLDAAGRHLQLLPGYDVGNAQHCALRSRLALLQGNRDAAEMEASVAVASLLGDGGDDVGDLMNGAISMMWCGEVLVGLGYGTEAARVVDIARQRIARAGIHDAVLEGGLVMVEAGAVRLRGDAGAAHGLLASIDQSASPDFGIQVCCERARLAWMADESRDADRLYRDAIAQCERLQYPALTRLISLEMEWGPPSGRRAISSVEHWAEERLAELLSRQRPYAVAAKLPVDGSPDRFLAAEEQIAVLLDANPHLGVLDGFGTDGVVYELFLDGDDPEALWEAVAPYLIPLAGPGSRVELRRGEDTDSLPIA
jgi:tetratricopeptide (TPR) repeat protein